MQSFHWLVSPPSPISIYPPHPSTLFLWMMFKIFSFTPCFLSITLQKNFLFISSSLLFLGQVQDVFPEFLLLLSEEQPVVRVPPCHFSLHRNASNQMDTSFLFSFVYFMFHLQLHRDAFYLINIPISNFTSIG